jgi:6-phospho-3-hexuloisomerase
MDEYVSIVLNEISQVMSKTDFSDYSKFAEMFSGKTKIICCGAGRVGFAMQSFSMRLHHLGLDSFFWKDSNLPRVRNGDILLVGSGSGSTSTVESFAQIGHTQGLEIALVTSNANSSIGKLAKYEFLLAAPNKVNPSKFVTSKQPMTSLFEQSLAIFLDAIVLDLMEKLGQTGPMMEERHNSLE